MLSKSSGPLLGCTLLLLWVSPPNISVMFIKRWQVYQASGAVFHRKIFRYTQGASSILRQLWAQSRWVNKAPSLPCPLCLNIFYSLSLLPLPGFAAKQEAEKEEVLFAWSVSGKEMATVRWTEGALFSYVTSFMEYISSLKNGIARTEAAEMTLSHTSNIMSQTTIVNTCISYWILYPHYRESVVHLSKVSSFRIFHSVCIGTVLPFLSACFVSLLERRFLL